MVQSVFIISQIFKLIKKQKDLKISSKMKTIKAKELDASKIRVNLNNLTWSYGSENYDAKNLLEY